jgi:hypothetical protein
MMIRNLRDGMARSEDDGAANASGWMRLALEDFVLCDQICATLQEEGIGYELRFSPDFSLPALTNLRHSRFLMRVVVPACVRAIQRTAFECCPFLSEVVFAPHGSLKTISGFSNCRSLTKITIPASVEAIEPRAFQSCNRLIEVIFEAQSHLTWIQGFEFCTALPRIMIPASTKFIYQPGFQRCDSLQEMCFENRSSFLNLSPLRCTNIRRIEIPMEAAPATSREISTEFDPVVFEREITSNWSLLKPWCDDLCVIDHPFVDFASIPDFVITNDHRIRVSGISDQLCCFCVSRGIQIPRFIRIIGSSFRQIENLLPVLEIPSSIEVIEGFQRVPHLEMIKFGDVSELRKISGFCGCESLISIQILESK